MLPNGTLDCCSVWLDGMSFSIFPEYGPFSDNPETILASLKTCEKNLSEHIENLSIRLETMRKAIASPPQFQRAQ